MHGGEGVGRQRRYGEKEQAFGMILGLDQATLGRLSKTVREDQGRYTRGRKGKKSIGDYKRPAVTSAHNSTVRLSLATCDVHPTTPAHATHTLHSGATSDRKITRQNSHDFRNGSTT